MKFEQLVELARVMRVAGASIESVLIALRSEGASQGSSLRALREAEGGSIGHWKAVVDSSRTWADRSESNETWRRQLLKVLDADAKPGSGEGPS